MKKPKQKFDKIKKKYKTNPPGLKQERYIPNIRMLTRIITYLSEVDSDTLTGIHRKTGLHASYLKEALNFLLHYKIVFIIKNKSGLKHYFLNPFYKK